MTSFTRFNSEASIRYALKASDILEKDFYYTMEDFTYHVEDFPSNKTVTVPAGFLTDGASIPRALWSFASPIGRHAQAAILHDYLCECLTVMVDGTPEFITRKEADQIFRESLMVLGVPKLKARTMYMAVSVHRILHRINKPKFDLTKRQLEAEIRQSLAK